VATTNYITVSGMIIGEATGGVSRAYGLDALGSVVATYAGTSVQNTYAYKPYGGLLAKTGTASDPSFLWNGGSGYRATTLANSDFYVRRRHYSRTSAQWLSVDRLWPKERAFNYCRSNPAARVDPSGLSQLSQLEGPWLCCEPKLISTFNVIARLAGTNYTLSPPDCPRAVTLTNQLGLVFTFTLTSNIEAVTGPSLGPFPCGISWEEYRSDLSGYEDALPNTCQQYQIELQRWHPSIVLKDAPGIDVLDYLYFDDELYFTGKACWDVCMHITFSGIQPGSCNTFPQPPPKTVERYFYYFSELDWDGVNPPKGYAEIAESNSNCKPRNGDCSSK